MNLLGKLIELHVRTSEIPPLIPAWVGGAVIRTAKACATTGPLRAAASALALVAVVLQVLVLARLAGPPTASPAGR